MCFYRFGRLGTGVAKYSFSLLLTCPPQLAALSCSWYLREQAFHEGPKFWVWQWQWIINSHNTTSQCAHNCYTAFSSSRQTILRRKLIFELLKFTSNCYSACAYVHFLDLKHVVFEFNGISLMINLITAASRNIFEIILYHQLKLDGLLPNKLAKNQMKILT